MFAVSSANHPSERHGRSSPFWPPRGRGLLVLSVVLQRFLVCSVTPFALGAADFPLRGRAGEIILGLGPLADTADTDPGLGDTWEWDGSEWTQVALSGASPPGRVWHAMTFDSVRGKTVLFGGTDVYTLGAWRADMWEWDGREWTRIRPVGNVPWYKAAHKMAFDSHRESIVLFGGASGGEPSFMFSGDTWEYSVDSGMPKGLWSLY